MKQAVNPILFLLANTPEAEQNLEAIMSLLQFTNDAVKNIKAGLDNFHATLLKMQETSSNSNR